MKRRELTGEERRDWQEATRHDIKLPKTIKQAAEKKSKPTPVPNRGGTKKESTPVPPLPAREVKKRLKTPPEAILDLHGLTQTAAHEKLERFVKHMARAGKRRLLIITGKGRGVLKQAVPLWLEAPKLRGFISSASAAPLEKGGEGALYVILKKSV